MGFFIVKMQYLFGKLKNARNIDESEVSLIANILLGPVDAKLYLEATFCHTPPNSRLPPYTWKGHDRNVAPNIDTSRGRNLGKFAEKTVYTIAQKAQFAGVQGPWAVAVQALRFRRIV
jgi:hypothetical protein